MTIEQTEKKIKESLTANRKLMISQSTKHVQDLQSILRFEIVAFFKDGCFSWLH